MKSWDLARAEEHLLSLELFGMRFGLERMRRLLPALGSPQERFRAVHVVGTNGKSLDGALHRGAAGGARRAHRLLPLAAPDVLRGTAPDRRRGRLGHDFAAAIQRTAAAAAKVDRTSDEPVTQFELLTAAAFSELARREVEVAVVEAGLGGRWDATNVLGAAVVVLTNVGLEHTRWLGPTIRDIAGEKLAVVRPEATLVLGDDARGGGERARGGDRRADRRAPAPTDGRGALPGYQRFNFSAAAAAARGRSSRRPSPCSHPALGPGPAAGRRRTIR